MRRAAGIADLENSRRKWVTIAELVVLARALNTTPIALLYPDLLSGEEIEMLPGIKATEIGAVQWFSALIEVPPDDLCDDRAQYRDSLAPVLTARKWELDREKLALLRELAGKRDNQRWDLLRAIARVQDEIDKLMASHGG